MCAYVPVRYGYQRSRCDFDLLDMGEPPDEPPTEEEIAGAQAVHDAETDAVMAHMQQAQVVDDGVWSETQPPF